MNYLQEKKKALMNYVSGTTPPLPSEYQQVEWIGSSGTQYIDTDYIPSANTKWELDMNVNANTWNVGVGCGCQTAPYNDIGFQAGHNSNTTLYVSMGRSDTSSTIAFDMNRHLFVLDAPNQEKQIDDNVFVSTATTFECNRSITLFATNKTNGLGSKGKFNIFSSKIYEDNALVQNLIPCYRKADNEIGMYDTVNDTFYTNQGSGTFTKGGDV